MLRLSSNPIQHAICHHNTAMLASAGLIIFDEYSNFKWQHLFLPGESPTSVMLLNRWLSAYISELLCISSANAPLPEPLLAFCHLDSWERTNFSVIRIGTLSFSSKKMYMNLSSAKMATILSRGRWVIIKRGVLIRGSSESYDSICA